MAQDSQVRISENLEEINLQTDRDIYITGEEICFRADYFLFGDKAENELSKSIYIELITPLGESVAKQKYDIVDGFATGKYPVPEGLLTATYMLRVYTQFQRNYPKEHFTTNLITIINPQVPLIGYQDVVSWKLHIAPEGNGISNNEVASVAIRIHPKWVKNVSKIKVIDQFENSIVEVKLFENGLGLVEFEVIDSLEYSCSVLMKNGTVINQTIPRRSQQILLEKEIVGASIKVKLSVPEDLMGEELTMQVYDGFFVQLYNQKIIANGEWKDIELNESKPGTSINYLILKDSDNKILRVDAVCQMPEKPQNIEVQTSEKYYDTRSKVDVSFTPVGDDFESYSISVVKKGTLENERLLIPNFILENPQLIIPFVENRPINNDEFTNQLKAVLLMNANRLFSDTTPLFEVNNQESKDYLAPETRGITIRGVVRNIASVIPEPNCNVYIAIIGNDPQLHVYTTNEKGEFIFTLKHISGIQNLFLCVDSEKENELEILVNSDFVNDYASFYATPTLLDTSMKSFIEDLYVNAQLKAFANANDTFSGAKKKYKPIRFPASSTSILVDDYIALPTLREVINEIVPYVKVQKKKDKFSLEVFDPVTDQLYGDPLILIDNLPVFNVNELLKIKPELVEKISVINSSYLYGEHLFRGIVFFETNTNNFAGIELPVSSTFLEFQAIEELDHYKIKNHTGQPSRIPDFRNVLYWNPDVTIQNGKGAISFITSDYEGSYEVIIRSVNEIGKFSLGTASFNVKIE